MTTRDSIDMAERSYEVKLADADTWFRSVERSKVDWHGLSARKNAAFQLHQAVEAAYACFLLVHTFYFPRSHNIKFLRSLAEDVDTGLVEAWPRESRFDRRRFELLKRAYVEARYSDQYEASVEDLEWLMGRARRLRDLVADLCRLRIAALKAKADIG